METLITYALWGKGELTRENAKAVLDTYVPENVGTIYRPLDIPRGSGLRTALDWFEDPDFLGEGGAVRSDDLIASLIYEREGPWEEDRVGDEVYLLALWPEVPQHEDFDFIIAVQDAGIHVIDLSRAWSDLDLSLYSRPAPTTEEKAEARAAAKAEKAAAAPDKKTRAKKLSDEPAAEEVVVKTPAGTYSNDGPKPVTFGEAVLPLDTDVRQPSTFFADQMMASIKAYIDEEIRKGINAAIAALGVTSPTPTVEEDRPPFDPPYVGEDTKQYYLRKSTGEFRPAEGKPRRGEEVHNLTDEEARKLGAL